MSPQLYPSGRSFAMNHLSLVVPWLVAFLVFVRPSNGFAAGLIGATSFPSTLISIDSESGMAEVIAPLNGTLGLGLAFPTGLAFDPSTRTLFGIDGSSSGDGEFDTGDHLLLIDPKNGNSEVIGPVGFSTVASLAFDPASNMLFGVDRQTKLLITIDPRNGESTVVGPVGFDVIGMDFDPRTGTLYGSALFSDAELVNELIRIDPMTGAGTSIGPFGFESITGLAFDPITNTLFGVSVITEELIAIDTMTGAGTAIGPLGVDDVLGLAFVIPELSSLLLIITAAALFAIGGSQRLTPIWP
jgi:DNA-binding beta-propeller fold protein YncE